MEDARPSSGTRISRPTHLGASPSSAFRQIRRSSVPFSNRPPIVRFLRKAQEYCKDDQGECVPHEPTSKNVPKSILKKSEHPILINETHMDSYTLTPSVFLKGSDLSVNEKIDASSHYLEVIVNQFSNAERQARGCIDVLSFPVMTTMGLEPLARFECGILLLVASIEHIYVHLKEEDNLHVFSNYVTEIVSKTNEILAANDSFINKSSVLVKKFKDRSHQWGLVMKVSNEFRVSERKIDMPIYITKRMPEAVSMYENEIDVNNNKKFRSEGKTMIFRAEGDFLVQVEIKENKFQRSFDDLDDDDTYKLILYILEHQKELIKAAEIVLKKAMALIDSKIFDDGYDALKKNIQMFEFDPHFDPICALELKQSLIELATIKEEATNTARHTHTFGKQVKVIMKKFISYTNTAKKQMDKGEENDESKTCYCFGPAPKVKLFQSMNNAYDMDFMLMFPVTQEFLTEFCHAVISKSGETLAASITSIDGVTEQSNPPSQLVLSS